MESPLLFQPSQTLNDSALLEVLRLSKDATAIYTSEDLMIGFVNDAMINIWGKDRSVQGKNFEEAIPEIKGQPFTALLQNVWRTGQTYTAKKTPANLVVDGRLQTFYFDFEYRAIKNKDGKTCYLLHTATDITESARQRILLAENERHEQELNDELAASNAELMAVNEEYMAINEELTSLNEEYTTLNEELSSTNEELTSTIEELAVANTDLGYAHQELSYNKSKLDQILNILAAPVLLLYGPDHIIASTNQALLAFWNKTAEEVLNKPMLEVFPELKEQPFPALWKRVLETGEIIVDREKPVYYNRKGGKHLFYIDYHYQPLRDMEGKINGVLATLINNTDKVLARKTAEHTETQLRLAVESSNLGTWHMDVQTQDFVPSARLKEIFGYNAAEVMTYEDVVSHIAEEHREAVLTALHTAIQTGQRFEQEYAITRVNDQQQRWVRATGLLYKGHSGQLAYFSGTVMDVTEVKQDDLRKNDFIGMVSHELKTPLTSLKAYLQMLGAKARKAEDTFTAGALDKADIQVKKMTSMINGFLNVSRLESGKIHLDRQRFDLEDLIEEVQEEVQLANPSYQIQFAKCRPLHVEADREKIGQVINNFLSNAIKYSPKGKHIELVCQALDGSVQVSVKDEGMGIKPHDLERLFERYYRVESKHTQTISGFGIGLYLCAEIIQRHNGKIWAESELGRGSTFCFSLPVL